MNFKNAFGLACATSLLASASAFAALPKAADLAGKMGFGFNIGNSLEVPSNPTAWGNPFPTQELLDSIKAVGFSTVRIPCAWDSHAPNGVITETWLDSVKTVVDFAIKNDLYVVLNIHHEGEDGWFQTHIGETVEAAVDTKMKNYWTQIANKFKDYDEHLLFAGANEPGSNLGDNDWNAAHAQTLMHYYQTFIDAVRATGGNNETRTLIIQGTNTDIDKSVTHIKPNMLPTDKQTGYMMFEVHYYSPYQYTIMPSEQDWGAPGGEKILTQYFYGDYQSADAKRNAGYNAWTNSVDATVSTGAYVDNQFQKIAQAYGIPVLIGEFGANIRYPELSGEELQKHIEGRIQWHRDVAKAAKKNGVIPVIWDMGNESTEAYDNMAYLRRQSAPMGKLLDAGAINAIREVYGLPAISGASTPSSSQVVEGDKAVHISYKTVQSDTSEAGTFRIDLSGANWSDYVAISFDMRVAGTVAGPCLDQTRDGCGEYGWASVSLFNMSGNWKWKEVSLGNVDSLAALGLKNYKVEFGESANQMAIVDAKGMKAIGINIYGTQFTGDMYLDNMLLWKADGTVDTLNNFDKKSGTFDGIASGSLIAANATGDWGTSTTAAIKSIAATNNKVMVTAQNGLVTATFNAHRSSQASVKLLNSLGQEIASKNYTAMQGLSTVQLKTDYRGSALLVIKQDNVKYVQKVTLK